MNVRAHFRLMVLSGGPVHITHTYIVYVPVKYTIKLEDGLLNSLIGNRALSSRAHEVDYGSGSPVRLDNPGARRHRGPDVLEPVHTSPLRESGQRDVRTGEWGSVPCDWDEVWPVSRTILGF